MTTPQSDVCTPANNTTATLKRRGLLAAAVACVAGFVAKFSEQPVSAGVDGDVVLGTFNATGSTTAITNTASTGGVGFEAFCNGAGGFGIVGVGSDTGVYGLTGGGMGIRGVSTSGYAMFGQISPLSSDNTIAIYAQNFSTYKGGNPGAGGFAIYGLCANGHGLVGATATAGGAAVVGASNGVAGAYAGAFYGSVVVSGNFTVVGGAKSAAVPHPDGSHRRLYCLESPESWFEDFGTAARMRPRRGNDRPRLRRNSGPH
jgi:hypothetical protein